MISISLLLILIHAVGKFAVSVARRYGKDLYAWLSTFKQRMPGLSQIVSWHAYFVLVSIARIIINLVWANNALRIVTSIEDYHARLEAGIQNFASDYGILTIFKDFLHCELCLKN